MTSDAKQMVANFVETLENLQKTEVTRQDVKDIGSSLFGHFGEGSETVKTARVILTLASGSAVCTTCLCPANRCDCDMGVSVVRPD